MGLGAARGEARGQRAADLERQPRLPDAAGPHECQQPDFGPPEEESEVVNGWRVETREVQLFSTDERYRFRVFVQYGRRQSDVRATSNRVKLFLGLGLLGGAALALLAGLATARRAM